MDTDFHYYGTGTAALAAGFDDTQAGIIANAAEFVDWYNSDYWSRWRVVDDGGRDVDGFTTPQLSCQTIGAKMAVDYDADIWNAFHFPPGNLAHPSGGASDPLSTAFRANHVLRPTKLSGAEIGKLCRPYSKFALDMINDTIATYQAINNGDHTVIERYLSPRAREVSQVDRARLSLVFVGVRMHVLADTWAHQDFTGEQNNAINSAGTLNYVYATKQHDWALESTTWKGSVWVFAQDTDCAAAPDVWGASRGHGQIGHFPDYSWLKFVYPPSWMEGGGYLLRDNPKEYLEAWAWLSRTMAKCLGGGALLPDVPDEIEGVIRCKRVLDSTQLSAVYLSEADWAKTVLGARIHSQTRWNANCGAFDNTARLGLGVVAATGLNPLASPSTDGSLPPTRQHTLSVRQNSTLHLMELASAMHYQWCINWIAANPDYGKGWSPRQVSGSN